MNRKTYWKDEKLSLVLKDGYFIASPWPYTFFRSLGSKGDDTDMQHTGTSYLQTPNS